MSAQHFDVVIVGGGMVGATLALALSRYAYRVALIEAHSYHAGGQPSFDDRAIALSWGSSRVLNQLKLWSAIRPVAEPITGIHVSDRGHFGITRIRAREERVPALGYVVGAASLGAALVAELHSAQAACTLFCPARVIELQNDDRQARLRVETEKQTLMLTAALVVAADGAQSSMRRLLDVAAEQKTYRQRAIIANITTQTPHRNIAYERFTDSGPIAVLPMARYCNTERCALIWTVPETDSQALLNAPEDEFLHCLQARFGFRLGHLTGVGARNEHMLSLVKSAKRCVGRVVFIGNAAQTLHPVAGQGFNLALRDTATLLDCLLYPDKVADPGNAALLQRFQSLRAGDQRNVIRFTDGLIQLFSNRYPLLGAGRAAALMALDTLPFLRRQLARQAMGLHAPLPHLYE